MRRSCNAWLLFFSFSFCGEPEFLTCANLFVIPFDVGAEKQSLREHQNSINDARRRRRSFRITSNVVDMFEVS